METRIPLIWKSLHYPYFQEILTAGQPGIRFPVNGFKGRFMIKKEMPVVSYRGREDMGMKIDNH